MLSLTDILGKRRLHAAHKAGADARAKVISPVEASDLSCPILRELFVFWQNKKAERGGIPARADFGPREIKDILPHIAMVDVEQGGKDFKFRVFGTRIAEEAGQDFSGRRWGDIAGAEKIIERSRAMVLDAEPYYAFDVPANWAPKRYKRYAVLGLPLSNDGISVDMILYGVVFRNP